MNDSKFIPSSESYDLILNDPTKYDKESWESIQKILYYNNLIHNISNDSKFLVLNFGDSKLSENNKLLNNYLYKPHERYITGYSMTTLVDSFGTFHIIHNSENYTVRHIMTGIINHKLNNIELTKQWFYKSFSNIVNLFYARKILV